MEFIEQKKGFRKTIGDGPGSAAMPDQIHASAQIETSLDMMDRMRAAPQRPLFDADATSLLLARFRIVLPSSVIIARLGDVAVALDEDLVYIGSRQLVNWVCKDGVPIRIGRMMLGSGARSTLRAVSRRAATTERWRNIPKNHRVRAR